MNLVLDSAAQARLLRERLEKIYPSECLDDAVERVSSPKVRVVTKVRVMNEKSSVDSEE